MDFNIRKAIKDDLPEVIILVKELALYENAPEEVTINLKDLEKDGFGANPLYSIIVAENEGGKKSLGEFANVDSSCTNSNG